MTTDTLTTDVPRAPAGPPKRSLDTVALAIGLVAAAGMLAWLFLGSADDAPPLPQMTAVPAVERPAVAAAESGDDVTEAVISDEESVGSLIERARLAADAGMIAEPAGNNALYYYSLALDSDPENETALAEIDVAVSDAAGQVLQLIGSGEWTTATAVANELAVIRGGHPVLDELDAALAAELRSQVARATAAATEGRGDEAVRILDDAALLPGADAEIIATARADVQAAAAEARAAEARRVAEQAAQQAAAAQSAEPAPAADEPPVAAVVAEPEPDYAARIRQSISLGRLTPPATNNAAALLVQMRDRDPDAAELAAVETEFAVALASAVRLAIRESDLDRAERMMVRWNQLGLPEDTAEALTLEVDQAFIARETAAPISAATLRRTKTVAPVYPRSAVRREVEGEVSLEYTVDPNGQTSDIVVTSSTAGGVFDRSAIRAVSQWEYEPRELRGRKVAQRVYARVNYSLE